MELPQRAIAMVTHHVEILLAHSTVFHPTSGLPLPSVTREVEAWREPLNGVANDVDVGRLRHFVPDKKTGFS